MKIERAIDDEPRIEAAPIAIMGIYLSIYAKIVALSPLLGIFTSNHLDSVEGILYFSSQCIFRTA